jgi:hypothetical protein
MPAFFSAAKLFFAGVPRWLWIALAAVALLIGGIIWHQHKLKVHDTTLVKATIATRDAAWKAAFDKERAAALAWKANADKQAATIANDERKIHDQAVASNAAVADALRLRGPGAAAAHCGQGNHSGATTPADRRDQAAPAAGAPTAQVPSDDRAIVSWNWLVQVAREHDDLLADVKTVLDADKKQRATWPTVK